ncbi:MAG: ABC transporter ATP-binding protein, partial [Thermoguttaceae bacterium]|nr:ABC transporter ATP-binding protein [Thermoguttaceae bacterium]
GKTTTFRILCALDQANGGEILLDGEPLAENVEKMRSQTGYVAQKFSLYGELTVRQNLEFFGGAYGVPRKLLRERIDWALKAFQLEPFVKMLAARLAMGYKRRLAMACALLHDPSIVFLDEATSGTDPISRREFWKRILDLADSGVAVIITTHFMDEAQYCDRLVIMRDGLSIAVGTVDEIRHQGADAATLEDAFVNLVT